MIALSSNPGLVTVHFPSYAPPHGHVKASSQYRDCTRGRTGFNFNSDLDDCEVPEAAVRIRSLVDVVGYALGVRRLDILLVNGRWPDFPNSHLVAAMDFPDRRVAIFLTRPMVFFRWFVCLYVLRIHANDADGVPRNCLRAIVSKRGLSTVIGQRRTECRFAATHAFSEVVAFPPRPSPDKRPYRNMGFSQFRQSEKQIWPDPSWSIIHTNEDSCS